MIEMAESQCEREERKTKREKTTDVNEAQGGGLDLILLFFSPASRIYLAHLCFKSN